MRALGPWMVTAAAVLAVGCGSDKAGPGTTVVPTDSVVEPTTSSTVESSTSSAPATTAPGTTVPLDEARLLYVDLDGIWLWSESGVRQQVREGSFAAALPDRLGGIVYQELATGEYRSNADMAVARWNWVGDGSPQPILWAPELGEAATVAVEPPTDGTVEIVDVALAGDHPLLAYLRTTHYEVVAPDSGENPWWDSRIAELVVRDLVTGDEQVVYEQSVGWEYSVLTSSLGDDTVGVVVRDYAGESEALELITHAGEPLTPGYELPQCAPPCTMEADLAPTGPAMAVAWRLDGAGAVEVQVLDRDTGAVVTVATLAGDGVPVAVDALGDVALVTTVTRQAIPATDWPPLRRGDSGPWVRVLQQAIPSDDYLVPDGRFGERTEAAVRALQTSNGLAPTGVVGPAEWQLMYISGDRLELPVLVEDGAGRVLAVRSFDTAMPATGLPPGWVHLWSD